MLHKKWQWNNKKEKWEVKDGDIIKLLRLSLGKSINYFFQKNDSVKGCFYNEILQAYTFCELVQLSSPANVMTKEEWLNHPQTLISKFQNQECECFKYPLMCTHKLKVMRWTKGWAIN